MESKSGENESQKIAEDTEKILRIDDTEESGSIASRIPTSPRRDSQIISREDRLLNLLESQFNKQCSFNSDFSAQLANLDKKFDTFCHAQTSENLKVRKFMKKQKIFNESQKLFNESQKLFNVSQKNEIEEVKRILFENLQRLDSQFSSQNKTITELIDVVMNFHQMSKSRLDTIEYELNAILQRMNGMDQDIAEIRIQIQEIFKRLDEQRMNGFH